MLVKLTKNFLKGNQIFTDLNKPLTRPFWHWLNHKWNEFDEKRVEEVGPNRACAEWLLKCGAQVKFKNWGSYTIDFNKLPPGGFEAYVIEEIKAEDACIMAAGFEYLTVHLINKIDGLKNVKKVKLVGCSLVDDYALGKLAYVRSSLEELHVVCCELVTDRGLSYLYLLKELKYLHLNYLPSVKEPELAVRLLKEKLPQCEVKFSQEPEIDPSLSQKNKKKKFFFF